jgi:hypothetical protein
MEDKRGARAEGIKDDMPTEQDTDYDEHKGV